MLLLALATSGIVKSLDQPRRTHPPRTVDALETAIADRENNIKPTGS
jgi:hypothetical protein